MAGKKTWFEDYLAEEVKKYKGVYTPVKAGRLECMFVRKIDCERLHPNPDDLFCTPGVGPAYRIISEYEKMFLFNAKHENYYGDYEPVLVEKIYPDGYMIINGHHRWAAALRLGFSKIPVKVVNITHEEDIRKFLEQSRHDKRVTLDLDEVVFAKEGEKTARSTLPFPLNRMYPERLRLGIPGLFRYLNKSGYDIWVYTSKYYSMDYLRGLFNKYYVHVSGIVTGIARQAQISEEQKKHVESMIANKYRTTIHIDTDSVLRIARGSKEFDDHSLSGSPEEWSKEIIEIISEMDKNE